MGIIHVVVGGQYGSEGKGKVAAYLARDYAHHDWAVRVGGPNAGHTVVAPDGHAYKLRHLPTAAATSSCRLAIADGSEIDQQVLNSEIESAPANWRLGSRLVVSGRATLIEDAAADERELVERIGSTGKGIGAARARRIMREAQQAGTGQLMATVDNQLSVRLRRYLQANPQHRVLVEGTQGYWLGLHTDSYPYCTSSDCRAIDFLAMAGLVPWENHVRVWLVIRAYPIRVAGNSGKLPGETSWEALRLPVEYTTVTNKPRRVGAWDSRQVAQAVEANGADNVAYMMLDHVFPEVGGQTHRGQLPPAARAHLWHLEQEIGCPITLVGTGPSTMIEKGNTGWTS